MTLDQGKGHRQWPDGAFAPSETFSPNLPVPINGRPRIKRSGRGECPVPPRLMGHTPSGLNWHWLLWHTPSCLVTDVPSWAGRGIRPVRNVFSEPAGSSQQSATDQTFGTGRMPRPAAIDGAYPVRLELALAALAYPVLLGDGRSIMGRTGHSPRPKRFLRTCRFQSTVGDGSNVWDGADAPSRRG